MFFFGAGLAYLVFTRLSLLTFIAHLLSSLLAKTLFFSCVVAIYLVQESTQYLEECAEEWKLLRDLVLFRLIIMIGIYVNRLRTG